MARLLVATGDGILEVGGARILEGHDVTALASDGETIWALAGGGSLHAERDGWSEVARLPDGVEGTSLHASTHGIFLGTEEAHLYRLDGDRLERVVSFDEAPARATWYTPWGGPPAVRSMAATPQDLFVNVHVGGILRTRDTRSWQPTIDIDTDVHEVVHDDDGRIVAALGVGGVAVSTDRGDSWDVTTDGLHGTYVRAVAVVGDALLAAASTGPFTDHAAVYRRARGSLDAFEPCGGGLPSKVEGNIDTGWLAANGSVATVITPDGSLFTSTDEGSTWEQVADGITEPRWLVVV